MAKSKSTRVKWRKSSIAGQSKGPPRRRVAARGASGKTSLHLPGVENQESSDSPVGGRGSPCDHGPDESVDVETGAQPRRPGGTGDASLGDDDEGPEGPAR
jgi:hypothetical protein